MASESDGEYRVVNKELLVGNDDGTWTVYEPGDRVELTEHVAGQLHNRVERAKPESGDSDDSGEVSSARNPGGEGAEDTPAESEPSEADVDGVDGDEGDGLDESDAGETFPHPSELTVTELREYVSGSSDVVVLGAMLDEERAGKGRATAIEMIESRLSALGSEE